MKVIELVIKNSEEVEEICHALSLNNYYVKYEYKLGLGTNQDWHFVNIYIDDSCIKELNP